MAPYHDGAAERTLPMDAPANSECRALGPVQTLYESESIHIIAGQRSHQEAADRFGP